MINFVEKTPQQSL